MTAKVILLQRRKNAVAPPIPPGLPEITALNFAATVFVCRFTA